MKKLVVALVFVLANGLASASPIKLECSVAVKTDYSSGTVENTSSVIFLDIETIKGKTFVSGTGDPLITVGRDTKGYKTIDLSDSEKWDFSVEGPTADTLLRIDRNTGALFYQRLFTTTRGGWVHTTVTGNCDKIDTSKRKF